MYLYILISTPNKPNFIQHCDPFNGLSLELFHDVEGKWL